jgi:hypothetical protein
MVRLALQGEAQTVYDGMRELGFVREGIDLDPDGVLEYLLPLLDPVADDTFTFSRAWLRSQAARIGDPRSPAGALGRQLNLPPSYLLVHRVTLGALGVLCQLGACVPARAEMQWWQPGFAEPGTEAAEHAIAANRIGRPLPTCLPEGNTAA